MWTAGVLVVAFWLNGGSEPAQVPRPACTEKTLGLMWPPQANDDVQFAKVLAREGLLETCRYGPWSFNWAAPTVHIRQLRALGKKPKPSRT